METTLIYQELSVTEVDSKTNESVDIDFSLSLNSTQIGTLVETTTNNDIDFFYNLHKSFSFYAQLKEHLTDSPKLNRESLIQSSSDLIDLNIVKSTEVILNEKWSNIINLQALIVSIDKDLIQCECLIDKENKLFETRTFPLIIFNTMKNLHIGQPILISIKSKPGSIRIDVNDGKSFVDKSLFEANADLEKLEAKFMKANLKMFRPNNA